ncbi:unnamed protein product, partial [Rotaria sp. Silwood1]
YGCKNKDDCAHDLAKNAVVEMLQRQYENPKTMNQLISFISSSLLTSNNSNLTCYDSDENELQCDTLTKPSSCFISNEIFQNTTNRSCTNKLILTGTVAVYMYQSHSSAAFTVYCNRTLCNTNLTLQAVKDIMFKYNVTAISDGRLVDTIPEPIVLDDHMNVNQKK